MELCQLCKERIWSEFDATRLDEEGHYSDSRCLKDVVYHNWCLYYLKRPNPTTARQAVRRALDYAKRDDVPDCLASVAIALEDARETRQASTSASVVLLSRRMPSELIQNVFAFCEPSLRGMEDRICRGVPNVHWSDFAKGYLGGVTVLEEDLYNVVEEVWTCLRLPKGEALPYLIAA